MKKIDLLKKLEIIEPTETKPSNESDCDQHPSVWFSLGTCLGASLGISFGLILGNIALGMCLGICFGNLIGLIIYASKSKEEK